MVGVEFRGLSLNVLRSKHGLGVVKCSLGCWPTALPTAVRRPGYEELVTLDLSVCASDRSCLAVSLSLQIIALHGTARAD